MAGVILTPDGKGLRGTAIDAVTRGLMEASAGMVSIVGLDVVLCGLLSAFTNTALNFDQADEALEMLKLAIDQLPTIAKMKAIGRPAGRA